MTSIEQHAIKTGSQHGPASAKIRPGSIENGFAALMAMPFATGLEPENRFATPMPVKQSLEDGPLPNLTSEKATATDSPATTLDNAPEVAVVSPWPVPPPPILPPPDPSLPLMHAFAAFSASLDPGIDAPLTGSFEHAPKVTTNALGLGDQRAPLADGALMPMRDAVPPVSTPTTRPVPEQNLPAPGPTEKPLMVTDPSLPILLHVESAGDGPLQVPRMLENEALFGQPAANSAGVLANAALRPEPRLLRGAADAPVSIPSMSVPLATAERQVPLVNGPRVAQEINIVPQASLQLPTMALTTDLPVAANSREVDAAAIAAAPKPDNIQAWKGQIIAAGDMTLPRGPIAVQEGAEAGQTLPAAPQAAPKTPPLKVEIPYVGTRPFEEPPLSMSPQVSRAPDQGGAVAERPQIPDPITLVLPNGGGTLLRAHAYLSSELMEEGAKPIGIDPPRLSFRATEAAPFTPQTTAIATDERPHSAVSDSAFLIARDDKGRALEAPLMSVPNVSSAGNAAHSQLLAPVLPPATQPPFHMVLNHIKDQVKSGKPSSLELTLTPEDLGKIRLFLTPDGDKLRIVIQAERAETMDLFRRNTEALTTELRDSGFSNSSFSFGGWGEQPEKQSQNAKPQPPTTEAYPASIPMIERNTAPKNAGLDLRV